MGSGVGLFELIFIETDEARMQVSILRPLHEIVISYPLDTPKTFGEESKYIPHPIFKK